MPSATGCWRWPPIRINTDRSTREKSRSGRPSMSCSDSTHPLQMFERWVLEDTELEGHHLAAGSKVGLLFGSANHDPGVFGPDADLLDLSRTPNPHVSYGAGSPLLCRGTPGHRRVGGGFCPSGETGAPIELDEKSDRIRSLVFRGVETLVLGLGGRLSSSPRGWRDGRSR